MTDQDGSTHVSHLLCYGCRTNPSLAKLDRGKAFVCHCTHVDGEISPVPYGRLDDKPERWKFVAAPDGDDEFTEAIRKHRERMEDRHENSWIDVEDYVDEQ